MFTDSSNAGDAQCIVVRAPEASCRCVAVDRWKSPPQRPSASSAATAPVVVLVRPQLAENVGAAARAMLNFGLTELRLVAPRHRWPDAAAYRSAAGADSVLDRRPGLRDDRRGGRRSRCGLCRDCATARHGETAVGAARGGARATAGGGRRSARGSSVRPGAHRASTTTTSSSPRASSTCPPTPTSRRSTWRRRC